MIFGDNDFYGRGLANIPQRMAVMTKRSAWIFACRVCDPGHLGVIEFNTDGSAAGIEAKLQRPKPKPAVAGLYIYNEQVSDRGAWASLLPAADSKLSC